jgi:hypothetical protein
MKIHFSTVISRKLGYMLTCPDYVTLVCLIEVHPESLSMSLFLSPFSNLLHDFAMHFLLKEAMTLCHLL